MTTIACSTSRPRPLALAVSSVVLATGMGLSGSVLAQGMALEEIIVTAQKRMETAQETPVSIMAISAEGIEKRGIVNSADLIGGVAGVGGFSAPGSRGATGLSMRGVSAGSPANVSLDPAVGLYMDGVYIGKLVGSSMDVAEIERMEILRGPQGTLYGRNSTAGAVNIITRKPTGEFGFRATATAGNYDLWGLKANLDLPGFGEVGEGLGKVSASLGFHTRQRGGLYANTSAGGDFDTIDRNAWRAAISWMPTDSVSMDYIYDYSDLDENQSLYRAVGFTPQNAAGRSRLDFLRNVVLPTAGLVSGSDPRINSRWIPSIQKTIAAYEAVEARGEGRRSRGGGDNIPTAENEIEGHSLTFTWEAGEMGALGDVTFKSITGYRELESYVFGSLEDIDSSLDANGIGAFSDTVHGTLLGLYTAPGSVIPGLTPGPVTNDIIDNVWRGIDQEGAYHSKQDTKSTYEQFSQEFQMLGATDRLDYALGVYYFEDESKYRRNAVFAAPLTGIPDERYELTTEAWAVFGQGTWRPSASVLEDRLSLTLGLRYTEEKKAIDQTYGGIISPLAPVSANPSVGGPPWVAAVPYPFVGPNKSVSNDENFHNLSGTFTAAWQFTEDFNGFLRYATGYRSGGFNGELFDNGFDEETIEQWELGIKSDWWNRRLRINGSLWTYTYEDIQVSQVKVDASGSTSTSITNAGEADRWGGELEILVSPVEDLVLGLSYSYIHGDFDKFPEVCTANSCIPGKNAAKRGAAPGNQLLGSADYVFARTEAATVRGYLEVQWQDAWAESALWTGTYGQAPSAQPFIYPHQMMDERTVVNARFSIEDIKLGDGTLKLSLWGKNLLDDDYPTFAINFASLGPVMEQYGEPLTYGLDVTFEYF